MAKVLLMSSLVGNFEEVLKRVSFLSTTESLMNLSFESKKRYYEEKIKIGESQNVKSDFDCWSMLFKFKKNLFHRKALKNISKIELQLYEILQKIPKTKIFFALCKDSVFVYLIQKVLKRFRNKRKNQIDFLFQIMSSSSCRNIGLLCALVPSIFKSLGLQKKYQKHLSKSSYKTHIIDYVEKKVFKIRKKLKSKKKIYKIEKLFKETRGHR
jgi:hypothetical protein